MYRAHALIEPRSSDANLVGVKRFRPLRPSAGLDSAQPHDRLERVRREPWFRELGAVATRKNTYLALGERAIDPHVSVRRHEPAVVFRHLVFEDQVPAKRVPRELAQDSMILMQV